MDSKPPAASGASKEVVDLTANHPREIIDLLSSDDDAKEPSTSDDDDKEPINKHRKVDTAGGYSFVKQNGELVPTANVESQPKDFLSNPSPPPKKPTNPIPSSGAGGYSFVKQNGELVSTANVESQPKEAPSNPSPPPKKPTNPIPSSGAGCYSLVNQNGGLVPTANFASQPNEVTNLSNSSNLSSDGVSASGAATLADSPDSPPVGSANDSDASASDDGFLHAVVFYNGRQLPPQVQLFDVHDVDGRPVDDHATMAPPVVTARLRVAPVDPPPAVGGALVPRLAGTAAWIQRDGIQHRSSDMSEDEAHNRLQEWNTCIVEAERLRDNGGELIELFFGNYTGQRPTIPLNHDPEAAHRSLLTLPGYGSVPPNLKEFNLSPIDRTLYLHAPGITDGTNLTFQRFIETQTRRYGIVHLRPRIEAQATAHANSMQFSLLEFCLYLMNKVPSIPYTGKKCGINKAIIHCKMLIPLLFAAQYPLDTSDSMEVRFNEVALDEGRFEEWYPHHLRGRLFHFATTDWSAVAAAYKAFLVLRLRCIPNQRVAKSNTSYASLSVAENYVSLFGKLARYRAGLFKRGQAGTHWRKTRITDANRAEMRHVFEKVGEIGTGRVDEWQKPDVEIRNMLN